jgi:hypothetical protein
MPRWTDEDDWDEDEYGSGDEEGDTIPCPYCRRDIHEDSVRCPYCEQYLSQEDAPAGPKPWWLIVGVAACLAAALWWVVRG